MAWASSCRATPLRLPAVLPASTLPKCFPILLETGPCDKSLPSLKLEAILLHLPPPVLVLHIGAPTPGSPKTLFGDNHHIINCRNVKHVLFIVCNKVILSLWQVQGQARLSETCLKQKGGGGEEEREEGEREGEEREEEEKEKLRVRALG